MLTVKYFLVYGLIFVILSQRALFDCAFRLSPFLLWWASLGEICPRPLLCLFRVFFPDGAPLLLSARAVGFQHRR